jgi:hypothetical protein
MMVLPLRSAAASEQTSIARTGSLLPANAEVLIVRE